ncbi:MAG: PLP-dependent aminotransferase family protein, partial [Chitinophagaceae bacterium]
MDSPVQIPFKSFVNVNPSDSTAIYLQIVFEFIKAIQLGFLPEGTKLPGTRILCKILSVNRNTLIKAFQELESQGFVEILPSKGIFILSDQKQTNRSKAGTFSEERLAKKQPEFSFYRSSLLENPTEVSELPLQFDDGLPDESLIHYDSLGRLYVTKLKGRNNKKISNKDALETHLNFKKTFSNLLNLTRNLRISESNLFTATSHEIGLYLVFKVLISVGDKVVVAAPSYYLSNMTISDSGAEIISVPVNDDGIDVDILRKICEQQTIRVLYLTSVYHYPTTTALSAKKRIEILELAAEYSFIIVEDDYDFEFHFDNNPTLPLAAMDADNRVVYISSLARSLPAAFNYGFVSAPEAFIIELEKYQNILSSGIDVIKEQVLTNWIQEGEIHRLVKKNKRIYKERRDFFAALL